MSYSRWNPSDWYAFGENDDRLALWHCNHSDLLSLSVEDCKCILETKDYEAIEASIRDGKITDEETMLYCIQAFIEDFEEDNLE